MRIDESQFSRTAEVFYEAAALPDQKPGALEFLGSSFGAIGVILIPVQAGQSSLKRVNAAWAAL